MKPVHEDGPPPRGWRAVDCLLLNLPVQVQGLVLADEPATTCYLPEHQAFVRWLGADSEADLIAAAKAVLADPTTQWEKCGVWETDGPAVLMDSVTDGAELAVEYPDGGGLPEQAPVPIRPGRWTVRAVHASPNDDTSVGLVQLLPLDGDSLGQEIGHLGIATGQAAASSYPRDGAGGAAVVVPRVAGGPAQRGAGPGVWFSSR
ncbi:Imm21 family immunity protein [Streptomyces sp. NPDC051211]|uniref:Imm21 family immunity protein n=1 Tax=Streptomyces sp. NPDC051211 TaxID=3154643 RepID=UPI00344BCF5D